MKGDMEPSLVSAGNLEALLGTIARAPSDPRAGLFGPGSVTWRINRESALFLGAGRAALLQLAHPWVAAAIAEHSAVLHRPIVRFHNTFRIVYTMVFGSRAQACAAARSLHTLHSGIRGQLPGAVGAWPRATHYQANEIAALRWVWATLVESAVLAYETVLPLTPADCDRYYSEMQTFAALFGIPSSALPSRWSAFIDYCRQMFDSGELGVNSASRSMGHAILSGAGSRIHPPRWYRALTTAWMPPRLRDEFALTPDHQAAARARRWLPRVYCALPRSFRFVGPYHEAQARLRGRRPRSLTRQSNRFWIGQPELPFGTH
jgi:uncharacterized protein (DUF2236 family)